MLEGVRRFGRAVALALRDHEDGPVREGLHDDEDRGWRRAYATDRDVPAWERQEAIASADDAWRRTPLGFRVAETTGELVLGRGMELASGDEPTQEFVTEWWRHPKNEMKERQFRFFREVFLTGELFVAQFVNPYDGMTYVRTLPSLSIDEIVTDPEDVENELRFHQAAGKVHGGRWWSSEEVAHYTLYRLEGATRGMAPIEPLLPWLGHYNEWLLDRVRLNKRKGAFYWDVTMTGADREGVLRRQQEVARSPNPGSVIVHGDDEKWQTVVAQIDAQDAAGDGKAIRRLIFAGAGLPMHYFSEADDSNRATAAEQERPVAMHVQRMQASFGSFMADLARRAAERSGRFRDGAVGAITAVYAEPNAQDNLTVARAGKTAAEALVVAVERGWIAEDEAAGLFRRVFGELTDTVGVTRKVRASGGRRKERTRVETGFSGA